MYPWLWLCWNDDGEFTDSVNVASLQLIARLETIIAQFVIDREAERKMMPNLTSACFLESVINLELKRHLGLLESEQAIQTLPHGNALVF